MSWDDPSLPQVAHILRALIDAPSPNPPGHCEDVARVCLEFLDGIVPGVEVVRAHDGTPSVLVTMGSGNRTLLIHSHYDTQPVSDIDQWHSDPYVADIRDGSIYGRGAGDDKGSVAAQLAAALDLARSNADLNCRVQFAFVADEESGGMRGTKFLREHGRLRADAVLVGEQTDNQLALGERGMAWCRVTLHGKPGHGAIPDAGISALAPAAAFVHRLNHGLAPSLRTRQPTPLLPPSSVNIGRLHAGNDVSTVPDTAVVEIDRRIVPGETPGECLHELQHILNDVLRHHDGVSAEWLLLLSSPAFLTDADDAFVTMARSCARTYGMDHIVGYQQSSDARFFVDDAVPIIICGPSDPRVGHAANECVPVDQLVSAQQFVTDLCRTFK
jgi:succinyl-diaminopimelate desuccinylase